MWTRRRQLLPTAFLFFRILCIAAETVVTLDAAHASNENGSIKFEESKATKDSNRSDYDNSGKHDSVGDETCQLHDSKIDNQNCMSPQSAEDELSASKSGDDDHCGVYLAFSTLPGTGIGMFAGRSFEKGDDLMAVGDHLIPLVSLPQHHGEGPDPYFLWDEYTWNPGVLRLNWEGVGTMVASPGFGAAANSFMDFVNVDEGAAIHSVAGGLHRSKDPGAGAFTSYHSRSGTTTRAIRPGEELFVDYSDSWFYQRGYLGPIPVEGDHEQAEQLYKSFKTVVLDNYKETVGEDSLKGLWDTFVLDSPWKKKSRVIAALPDKEDYDEMLDVGLIELKTRRMVRSMEWLESNGVCADNMKTKVSTLPQAGHGAFANKFLAKDSVILPVPLIPIPDSSIFNMYEVNYRRRGNNRGNAAVFDRSQVTRTQLMLNYCLGHEESTMLLSPYGPAFSLINHNQTMANVRLQWADPNKSNHDPGVLSNYIDSFYDAPTSKIAMELVALRDIHPDEEIFLDYGDAWEAAWQEHLATWEPYPGSEEYVSAEMLNEDMESPLLTQSEQRRTPYPDNVQLKFDDLFDEDDMEWKEHFLAGTLDKFKKKQIYSSWIKADIVRRRRNEEGVLLYRVAIWDPDEKDFRYIDDLPREAFAFINTANTSDMLLKNAFRHKIGIPNELFPEVWKNKKRTKR